MPNTNSTIRLFGILIDLKVNLLALVACILSIGSIVLNVTLFFRGSKVIMSSGERVNLIQETHPAKGESPFLLINARLDYVNTGAIGRDAIVSKEWVEIYFSDLTNPYEYRWLHFENYIPDKTDKSGGAKQRIKDGAHSFIVPGSDAVSHQTTFAPFSGAKAYKENSYVTHVKWENFLSYIENKDPMILRFFAQDRRGGSPYEAACTVIITNSVLKALLHSNWATALCIESPPLAKTSKTSSSLLKTPIKQAKSRPTMSNESH